MMWGSPENFKWLWLAAAVALAFVLLDRRRKALLRRLGDVPMLEEMSSTLDAKRRSTKRRLAVLAVLFAAVALAEPQLPGKSVLVKQQGLDIVLAVDVSQSMMAEDILPNRLAKAKLELEDFVEKAKGDRIGVVAFAGQALVQVPLTIDRSAVKLFIKSLSPDLIPVPGTAVGEAVRASLSLFPEEKDENRIIVLLTDGEDQGSDPVGAAKAAKKQGTRVYAIGIGTPKGEMIPQRQPGRPIQFKKDLRGNLVVSKLDEKTLQQIAEETGGVYYRSQKGNLEVDRIYSDIRALGGKETGSGWMVERDPLYFYPLVLALLLLVAELGLSERKPA